MKKILLPILSAVTFGLFSCSDALSSFNTSDFNAAQNQKIRVTTQFELKGAVPENLVSSSNNQSKTAFPTVPDNNSSKYIVTLYNLTDNEEKTNENSGGSISVNPANKTVSLELELNKTYKIKIQCVKSEDTNTVLFSGGSSNFSITQHNPVYSEKIILQPSTSGAGTVNLPFTIPSNYTPAIVKVTNFITGQEAEPGTFNIHRINTTTPSIFSANTSENPQEISSGQYAVEIELKNTNGYRVYNFTEVINVFDSLETNRYVANTNCEYYVKDANENVTGIEITQAHIDNFQRSTMYVDSNSTSTEHAGTWSQPYLTLAEAIAAIPSGSTTGNIHIKDGHSELITTGYTIDKPLTIECYKDIVGDGKGNATFKFNDSGINLFNLEYIPADSYNFTLTGLTCDGNEKETTGGGLFLFIPENFIVTATNCTFKNASSTGDAAGAAIGNEGTLTLINCTLTNNVISYDPYSSQPTYGGAIVNFGTLTLNNTTITENSAEFAGGIYTTKDITILGKTIIKDNIAINSTYSTKNNLYLALDDDNNTPCINTSNTSPSQGADIHFSTEDQPQPGRSITVIKNCNGFDPNDFFTNDDLNSIVKNGNNAILQVGGGLLVYKTFDNITIGLNKDSFQSIDEQFTITVKDGSNTLTSDDVPSVEIKWYEKNNSLATTSTTSTDRFTFQPDASAFSSRPRGTYSAVIKVTYKSIPYQASFDIDYYDTYRNVSSLTTAPSSGTYAVRTANDLNKIMGWAESNTLSSITFYIANDITVDDNFTLGTSSTNCFRGKIYGNNHTISGLAKPLISYAGPGLIKDLTIEGQINGNAAFIDNLDLSSGTTATYNISNCINKANVSSSSTTVGAFVANCTAQRTNTKYIRIQNCINYGDINTSSTATSYAGGISGKTYASISDCANYGTITSKDSTGGIAGTYASISNCINYGTIIGKNAGGIIGYNKIDGKSSINISNSSIYNSVNMGTINGTGNSPNIGQIIGINEIEASKVNFGGYNYCYYLKGADFKAVGNTIGTPSTDWYAYDFYHSDDGTNCYTTKQITPRITDNKTNNLIELLKNYSNSSTNWQLDNSIPKKPMLIMGGN